MIEEALIYSTAFIITIFIIKSYMIKVAQIESDTQISKANAYAHAQQVGSLAEAGAWNMGHESNGLESIEGIMGLLNNPMVQGFLQKMQNKEVK